MLALVFALVAFPVPVPPPPPGDAPPSTTDPTTPATTSDAPATTTDEPGTTEPSPTTGVQRDESGTKEEPVDFDEEDKKSDDESKRIRAGAGGGGGAVQETSSGLKMFVDFEAVSDLNKRNFVFRPNHTYVFVMAQVSDDIQFIIHVDTNPIFFELQWDALPGLSFKVGKIFVPFGTNEFHHIMGGRVDEQSFFLPETWSDYGVAMNHQPIDTDWLNVEYTLYAVNGSQGQVGADAQSQTIPTVGAGASATDNNYMKALGGRAKLTLLSSYVITPSVYFDVWDPDNKFPIVFYSLGFEARKGFIKLPIVDRLRLRGEYGYGEIALPFRNLQPGVLSVFGLGGYAVGRAAFYAEATESIVDTFAVRLRTGRINDNNTLLDNQDLWVLEPSLLYTVAHGKVQLTLAYQFITRPDFKYSPQDPGDRVYGKVFLQF